MGKPRLTLDTSVIQEYLRSQAKANLVRQLLGLADADEVDLAVTARVHEDISYETLASKLNTFLHDEPITKTGSIMRIGRGVIGRDMLGDDNFEAFYTRAKELVVERIKTSKKRRGELLNWKDWDHLHSHYLQGRDVFLTWDNDMLCLAPELKAWFGIEVMAPEEYFQSRGDQ